MVLGNSALRFKMMLHAVRDAWRYEEWCMFMDSAKRGSTNHQGSISWGKDCRCAGSLQQR